MALVLAGGCDTPPTSVLAGIGDSMKTWVCACWLGVALDWEMGSAMGGSAWEGLGGSPKASEGSL